MYPILCVGSTVSKERVSGSTSQQNDNPGPEVTLDVLASHIFKRKEAQLTLILYQFSPIDPKYCVINTHVLRRSFTSCLSC